jgi:hypothetical protein
MTGRVSQCFELVAIISHDSVSNAYGGKAFYNVN